MAVPPQGELHRPLLEIAAEAKEALSAKQFLNEIVVRFSLTPEDLNEMIPSRYQSRIFNRVVWGLYELAKAGLLEKPSTGLYQITNEGRDYLKNHSGKITTSQLKKLRKPEGSSSPPTTPPDLTVPAGASNDDDSSPQDKIDVAYFEMQEQLADELLDNISQLSPEGFERLVVNLLEKMGYGKGEAVGRSGDGGIDGIINQDALGLEKVYIQAKRWKGQVGEPEIRNFSGSLDPIGATKGVFVSTSRFSESAKQTAQSISNKVIRLIDGPELAKLMLDHDVGVITTYAYKIQALDENYFADEL